MRLWRHHKLKSDTLLLAEAVMQLYFNKDTESVRPEDRQIIGMDIVDRALTPLSKQTQEIVKRTYCYRQTQREVADAMKITKYRVAKTLAFWRDVIEKRFENAGMDIEFSKETR